MAAPFLFAASCPLIGVFTTMHGTIPLAHLKEHLSRPQPWEPGDDPTAHPLWEEQINLEMEMIERGAHKYKAKIGKARDKEEMTDIKAISRRVEEMVPEMELYLKAWLRRSRTKKGARPVAFPYLEPADPTVACYITLRAIFDVVTIGTPGLVALAKKIGMELEYQARMEAWRAKAPDVFYGVQNASSNATARHKRRVNINRFNTLMREKLDWRDWPADIKRDIGFRLIDIAVQATRAFEVSPDPLHYSHPRRGAARSAGKGVTRKQYVITLVPELTARLLKDINADEMRSPMYMPTLMPPKRWEGIRDGGYYAPMVHRPTLIRFHASSPEQRQNALAEYDSLDMPRVMSALHTAQEVPWCINQKVLAVASKIWEHDYAMAGLPKRDILDVPQKPEGFKEATHAIAAWETQHVHLGRSDWSEARKSASPEVRAAYDLVKDWKVAAAAIHHDNATRVSKARSVATTLELAEKFLHREFYFPHMLDFRGRMYPIPAYLQPQGNDLARGLLTFAKGVRLGEAGGWWLAIHLANHFGMDKVGYEQRVEWVAGNEEMWRRIAQDPLRNREWITMTSKKHHWQALAAVFEWVRALDEGDEMVSALPIHIDGTCNGIQHLSAMMRDEAGGASVNLIPNEEPQDIYRKVAEVLQERLEGIRDAGGAQGKYAQMWLDVCDGSIPRSLTKTPVMTTPYGATHEAHFGSTYKWLKEEVEDKGRRPFGVSDEENKEYKKLLVPWLVKHLSDAVDSIVTEGKVCMKWLQDAAKAVAECNMPIVWRTPSGFVVRHFYAQEKQHKAETLIDGKRIQLSILKRTQDLSTREQLQGIAPNFTHSMDASANTETIIRMALDPRGLPITAIHDAYGTCAGAMWVLHNAVRQAFIAVHEHDVMADYRNCCVRMFRDWLRATRALDFVAASEIAEETIPRVPPRGELDVRAVASSDYFFA